MSKLFFEFSSFLESDFIGISSSLNKWLIDFSIHPGHKNIIILEVQLGRKLMCSWLQDVQYICGQYWSRCRSWWRKPKVTLSSIASFLWQWCSIAQNRNNRCLSHIAVHFNLFLNWSIWFKVPVRPAETNWKEIWWIEYMLWIVQRWSTMDLIGLQKYFLFSYWLFRNIFDKAVTLLPIRWNASLNLGRCWSLKRYFNFRTGI